MKQNQTFKTVSPGRRLPVIVLSVFMAFTLGSCCWMIPGGVSAKKRPCNCDQQSLADAKNPAPALANSDAVTTAGGPNQAVNEPAAGNPVLKADKQNAPVKQTSFTPVPAETKKMPFGIKAINTHVTAGPNLSMMSPEEDGTNNKSGGGFQAGISSNYVFSKNFSVNPSLIFRQANFSTTSGSGSAEDKTKFIYNFLSAPILAKIRASERVHVSAGPELILLLSAVSKYSSSYGGGEKQKITDESKRFGLGLEANVNVRLTRMLAMQLFINRRLSGLDKEETDDYTPPGGGGSESQKRRLTFIGLNILCALCNNKN